MPDDATSVHSLVLADLDARPLVRTEDERGWITVASDAGGGPLGASRHTVVTSSRRGVLRGVYVHPAAAAQLALVEGMAMIGLHDLRPASATYGRSLTLELGERHDVSSLTVPAGVAYALWFTTPAVHTLSSARSLDPVDEFACRWDDPGLGFRWRPSDPVLSRRDALASSLNALRASVAAALG